MPEQSISAKCDFCHKPAVYDGKTQMGPWAYMCEDCRKRYGVAKAAYMRPLATMKHK